MLVSENEFQKELQHRSWHYIFFFCMPEKHTISPPDWRGAYEQYWDDTI